MRKTSGPKTRKSRRDGIVRRILHAQLAKISSPFCPSMEKLSKDEWLRGSMQHFIVVQRLFGHL